MSEQLNTEEDPEDKLSVLLQIISFCIPIVGGFIYYINKDYLPKKAKSATVAALLGVMVAVIIQLILVKLRD